MNVSLNGSGAGGVRDLMDILHRIDQGGEQDAGSDEILVGLEADEAVADGGFEKSTTTPEPHVEPIASVLKKGPDIHGNMGDHRQRQTGLPRAQMESLVANLKSLYEEIKGEKLDEDAYDDINKGGFRFFQPTPWDQDAGDLGPNAALAGSAGKGNKNHWILSKMTPADYVTPGRPDIDRVNFLRKWARDHNDLTLQQWIQKGGNELTALVTGKPAEKVTYDKMSPGNGIGAYPTTPTKENVNESSDVVKLSKILNG
jgi:hypothetical protein